MLRPSSPVTMPLGLLRPSRGAAGVRSLTTRAGCSVFPFTLTTRAGMVWPRIGEGEPVISVRADGDFARRRRRGPGQWTALVRNAQ